MHKAHISVSIPLQCSQRWTLLGQSGCTLSPAQNYCQSIKWNLNLDLLTSVKFPRVAFVLRPFTVHYKMVKVKGALSAGMLWNYDNSWAGDVDQVSNSTRLHLERGHRVVTHVRQRTLPHHVSLQAEAPWPAAIFRLYATGLQNGSPGKAFWQVLQPNGREKRFMAVGTNGWGVSLASPSKSQLPPRQSFSWLSWIFFSFNLVQLHLFLMIQLSMVILETHTVWIWLISTKDGKMETSHIRQRQRLSRYFYGRGDGLASTSTTLRHSAWLDMYLLILISFSSTCAPRDQVVTKETQ